MKHATPTHDRPLPPTEKPPITSTLEASWPHVSLATVIATPIAPAVRPSDRRSRPRRAEQQSYHYNHVQSFFFKTQPDAKSVTLTVIVHKGHEFEFFVRPPELKDERRKW